MFSPLEQFDVIRILPFNFYGLPLFSVIVPLFIVYIVFYFFMDFLKMDLKIVPKSFQKLFESLIEFIFNLIKQQIGKEGYIFFPFIFVLFIFVLTTNLLGLIPFGIALTSHLIMILWLSLSTCLGIFFLGLSIHNIQFLKLFIPECPILLLPMLIIIEIFSYIIRAFSLAIRLSANIMAGHTLVFIIANFLLINIKSWILNIAVVLLLMVLCLELGVAFLQAYVFVVLLCIYIKDSIIGPSGH